MRLNRHIALLSREPFNFMTNVRKPIHQCMVTIGVYFLDDTFLKIRVRQISAVLPDAIVVSELKRGIALYAETSFVPIFEEDFMFWCLFEVPSVK
jgi:hypothetical protein